MRALKDLFFGALLVQSLLLEACIGFCGAVEADDTEAAIYLTDSTTDRPINAPSFTEEGRTLYPTCQEPDEQDPNLCTSQVLLLRRASHTITISAEGYRPETVVIDTSTMVSVHLAVELAPME